MLSFFQKPPPPPPPPPPSFHLYIGVSSEYFIQAATVCLVLAAVSLLASWLLWSKMGKAKNLVSRRDEGKEFAGKIVVVSARGDKFDSSLLTHVRRMLNERGFEVRSATSEAELMKVCKGAHVAIDVATAFFGTTTATAATDALIRACTANGVTRVVQCSDALVGYDEYADVCDGDELSDPGVSLISPEPRVPPKASSRLVDLQAAEESLKDFTRSAGTSTAALIVRLHRVYSPDELNAVPAWLTVLLASGAALVFGHARAQTNLLHVEDAACAPHAHTPSAFTHTLSAFTHTLSAFPHALCLHPCPLPFAPSHAHHNHHPPHRIYAYAQLWYLPRL